MKYDEFKSYVVNAVKDMMEPGTEVSVNEVQKNNGVVLDGLSILRPGEKASPVLYLQEYYNEVSRGDSSAAEAAEKIIRMYNEHKTDYFGVEQLVDFEKVRSQLYPKIVNRSRNGELIKSIPHRSILDLEIVYYQELPETQSCVATRTIRNKDLEMWGISEDELHDIAVKNMRLDKPVMVESMPSIFMMFGDSGDSFEIGELMFVVTTKNLRLGAVFITEPDIFKKISEKIGGDLYIIPSSVHEVIVIPASSSKANDIKEIVMQVNITAVSAQEFLSNSVYFYDKEKNEISIAA